MPRSSRWRERDTCIYEWEWQCSVLGRSFGTSTERANGAFWAGHAAQLASRSFGATRSQTAHSQPLIERSHLHGKRVGARTGFGEAEGRGVGGGQAGQPLVLELLGAPEPDGVVGKRVLNVHQDGHGRVHFGNLLDGNARRGEVHAGSAVLLGDLHAHQAVVEQRLHIEGVYVNKGPLVLCEQSGGRGCVCGRGKKGVCRFVCEQGGIRVHMNLPLIAPYSSCGLI